MAVDALTGSLTNAFSNINTHSLSLAQLAFLVSGKPDLGQGPRLDEFVQDHFLDTLASGSIWKWNV